MNFTSLNCKLKISLDQNYDILIEICSENNDVSASSLNNQGKGVIKLIKLILILNLCIFDEKNNYIVLIDEIENELSINTQVQLLKYLKSIITNNKNIFIVMTTHSPMFFWKENKDDKYNDYLNVILCYLNKKEKDKGLQYLITDNIDNSLKEGMELEPGKVLSGIDVLMELLDAPEKFCKKLFKNN